MCTTQEKQQKHAIENFPKTNNDLKKYIKEKDKYFHIHMFKETCKKNKNTIYLKAYIYLFILYIILYFNNA